MSAPRDPLTPAPDIRVHIERIVLVGVPAPDRAALSAAAQDEVARLFTERGWPGAPNADVRADRVDGGTLRHGSGARESELGVQIGAAVHGGLTR